MVSIGSSVRIGLTATCPIRGCKVDGFDMKAGQVLNTPLGTYIEDNDTMHIPPHAVGKVEHFAGGDLWTLQPCGHTFRELPEAIAAEFKELREAAAEKPITELIEVLRNKRVGSHVPKDDAALDDYLRSVALAVLRRDR
jgi:hypothetical protein